MGNVVPLKRAPNARRLPAKKPSHRQTIRDLQAALEQCEMYRRLLACSVVAYAAQIDSPTETMVIDVHSLQEAKRWTVDVDTDPGRATVTCTVVIDGKETPEPA